MQKESSLQLVFNDDYNYYHWFYYQVTEKKPGRKSIVHYFPMPFHEGTLAHNTGNKATFPIIWNGTRIQWTNKNTSLKNTFDSQRKDSLGMDSFGYLAEA